MAKAKNADNKRPTGKKHTAKASKKGAAKKSSASIEAATGAVNAQPCLSLSSAAFIVGGCLPSGSHNPSDTLEEVGLITENLRLIFRECVFNGVLDTGCEIERGEIPNDADTTVGDVIKAVFENAR